MKIKQIILPILFVGSLAQALYANNFDYYSDGVYDAYIQLSRDMKEGINERYMKEYAGKYVVAVDVQNSSTVDIIFYKTIGKKLGLKPIVVKYTKNKRNYLAFDFSNGKADAARLQKRLIQYGLRPRLLKGGDGYSFKRNPIVARRLMKDVKKADHKKAAKKKNHTVPKFKKSSKIEKSSSKDFSLLKSKFCASGFIQETSIHMGGKNYRVGSSIKGFEIIATKQTSSGWAALLLGPDTLYYKLKKSSCGVSPKVKSKTSKDMKKNNTTKTKKVKKKSSVKTKIKESKKNIDEPKTNKIDIPLDTNVSDKNKNGLNQRARIYKTVTCDFTKVETARDASGNFVRISDTTYFNKPNWVVDIKEEDNRWKIRHSGSEIIYLSNKYFQQACR